MARNSTQSTPSIGQRTRSHTKEPKMFRVIMHNDDITTMEFVVMVLTEVFHKSSHEATSIMLQVHTNGKATVGTYTFDVAKTLQNAAVLMARDNGYPLHVTVEPA